MESQYRGIVAVTLCTIIISSDFVLIFAYYAIQSRIHGCTYDKIILRINCSAMEMHSLPVNLPPSYYSLYFDFNNVEVLNNQTFNISSVANIRELSIVGSNVHSVEEGVFSSLTHLLWLDMRYNFLHTLPYGIDRMTKLQMLDLSGNQITSIPPDVFNNHHRLSTLFLEDNLIDVFSIAQGTFAGLVNLRKLSISYNLSSNVNGEPSYVDSEDYLSFVNSEDDINSGQQCLNISFLFDQPEKPLCLIDLRLANNEIRCLTEGTFNDWFINLQVLDLSNNLMTSLESGLFEPLIHLEEIYLDSNQLQNISASVFSRNTALRVLSLKHNKLQHFPPYAILPVSSSLERMDVSHNLLKIWEGTSQGNYHRLGDLNLESNHISGDKAIQFTNIPYLRSLNLASNKLQYFPNVTKLRHLKVLILSFNRIRVLPEDALHGCRRLKELKITHNLLRTVQESVVMEPINLKELDVAYNPLVCDCNLLWLEEGLMDQARQPDFHYSFIYFSTCGSPKFLKDKYLVDALEKSSTEFICSEFANPTDLAWLISIWFVVVGLIVFCKLYHIFPGSRRKFHAMKLKEKVIDEGPSAVGFGKRDTTRKKGYKLMGEEVDTGKQPRRLSSPTSSESPLRSLPSSIRWSSIPETQV